MGENIRIASVAQNKQQCPSSVYLKDWSRREYIEAAPPSLPEGHVFSNDARETNSRSDQGSSYDPQELVVLQAPLPSPRSPPEATNLVADAGLAEDANATERQKSAGTTPEGRPRRNEIDVPKDIRQRNHHAEIPYALLWNDKVRDNDTEHLPSHRGRTLRGNQDLVISGGPNALYARSNGPQRWHRQL